MSQINFDNLTRKRPDLAQAWQFLDQWIAGHPTVHFLSLERLAKAGRDISARELAEALGVLCELGAAKEVYRVQDIDGVFLEGEYESLDKVPSIVPDRLHQNYINTADVDVVPGYRIRWDTR